jgi:hypothetical protein
MAKVAAESVMEEELEAKRSSRARTLSKWKKEELLQKYTLMVREAFTTAAEAMEDMLRGLETITIKEGELARVEVLRGAMRKAHLEVTSTYTCTEIGNRLGLQALDKIFDTESVEGLTEEEKKLMQAYLKEQQEGGGKWKKKAGGVVVEAATAASNSYYTGFPGCNYYQQPMPPHLQQQYSAMWQSGAPAYGGGGQHQQQATGGYANMREEKKAKFPCDNRGQLGTGSTSRCALTTANTWRRCSRQRRPTEPGKAERQQQAEDQ